MFGDAPQTAAWILSVVFIVAVVISVAAALVRRNSDEISADTVDDAEIFGDRI